MPEGSSEREDPRVTNIANNSLRSLRLRLGTRGIHYTNLLERVGSILSAEELVDEEDNDALMRAFGVSMFGVRSGTNGAYSGLLENYIIKRVGSGLDAVKGTVPWALTADQVLENLMSNWVFHLRFEVKNPDLWAPYKLERWQTDRFIPERLKELGVDCLSGEQREQALGRFLEESERVYKEIFNFTCPLFESARTDGIDTPYVSGYISPEDFYLYKPEPTVEKMFDRILSTEAEEGQFYDSKKLVARFTGLPPFTYEEFTQRIHESEGTEPEQTRFRRDLSRRISNNIFVASLLGKLQYNIAEKSREKGISGQVEARFNDSTLIGSINPSMEPYPYMFSIVVSPDEQTFGPNYRRSGEGYQRSAVDIYLTKKT